MEKQSARSAEERERERETLRMKQEMEKERMKHKLEKERMKHTMEKERMMEEYRHRRRQVTLRKIDRYGNTLEISADYDLLPMMEEMCGLSYGQSPIA